LLYVVAPGVSFPANATNAMLPVQHSETISLTNWPTGKFVAEWYDPATAAPLGITQTVASDGGLVLTMPDYTEDLAAVVYQPPRLIPSAYAPTNGFQFRLVSETGGRYLIQQSLDLVNWMPYSSLTNSTGTSLLRYPLKATDPQRYFRALQAN
jgi:hypothetical protein